MKQQNVHRIAFIQEHLKVKKVERKFGFLYLFDFKRLESQLNELPNRNQNK
ncbi:hypothetical protein [Enterococcus sp. DIV0876]|uniref:hypothetical protein n=1 Tax=Enterococcus sp. DIV0876 TaxID=2774633 RepID=UPI003D2FCB17